MTCTCVAISASAGNNKTYKQLWNEVKIAEKKDLPRNGIKICDEIYAKANAENNGQQMLKAFIYRMNLRGRIDNDSIKADANYLKDWQQRETRPVLKAVLSYYLAQQYYYDDEDSIGLTYIRKSLADKDKLAASTSASILYFANC